MTLRRLLQTTLLGLLVGTSRLVHAEVTPPTPLSEVVAEWPASVQANHDVFVPLLVVVSQTGEVEEATLDGGVGAPFDAVALRTVRQMRFEPARDASRPRSAKIRLLVHFKAPSPTPDADPSSANGEPPHPDQANSAATTEVTVQATAPHRSASELRLNERVLRAAPHKSGSDLLSVVPGVFISQHSGEGKAHQIFFRGFDAAHGQDLELWAGGIPVNDVSNVHGQGYADMHFLIPEVVPEIAVTPGSYDPRQGDFAVAGSMRFGLGYNEPGATLKASAGAFGTRRYFMGYRPEGADRRTFGAFELYNTDGFGPNRAARRGSAIGQAVFELGRGVSGRVLASTYAGRFDSAGVIPLDDIRAGRIDRFGTYDTEQGGYSSRSQLLVELTNDAEDRDQRFSIAPFVVLRTLKLRSNFTGALTHPAGDSIQQFNDALTVGATASYSRELDWFSLRDRWEAGVFLRNDQIRQSQHRLSQVTGQVTDDSRSPGLDVNLRATNVAGYLDLNLHPLERVALRGGLRMDGLSYLAEEAGAAGEGQVRTALGAQLSKRATLDVAVSDGLRALASYGEGFRSPQIRALGDGETTPFTRVVSYEVGLKYARDQRLQAGISGYRTDLSDDLVLDPATARNELVPSTRRLGVTANVVAEPASWFVSSVSLTYARAAFTRSDARFMAGTLVPYAPQVVGRSDLAARTALSRLGNSELLGEIGLGLTYFGRRPLPYSEMGHDALLADGFAELRWGRVRSRFEVFNLLDAGYYDGEFVYASRFGETANLVPARHVSVGAPRTWLWSLGVSI